MATSREQRQAARVTFHTPVRSRVRAVFQVRVLDLSLRGARIEHPSYLRPGSPCTLELPPSISPIVLRARVVRSSIVDIGNGPWGEGVLRYQTGVEFLDVNADERAILTRVIERFSAEKSGSCATWGTPVLGEATTGRLGSEKDVKESKNLNRRTVRS